MSIHLLTRFGITPAAAPAPPSGGITFVAVEDGTAISSTRVDNPLPTGAENGDLLLSFVWWTGNSAAKTGVDGTGVTPPSGWTLLQDGIYDASSGADTRIVGFYKLAGGSEPSMYQFDIGFWHSSGTKKGTIAAYRGVAAVTGSATNTKTAYNSSPAPSPAVDVPAGGMLFTAFSSSSGVFVPPGSMTSRKSVSGLLIADEVIPGGELAATRSVTASGNFRAISIAAAFSAL